LASRAVHRLAGGKASYARFSRAAVVMAGLVAANAFRGDDLKASLLRPGHD